MQVAKQTTSVAHLGADRFAKMLFPRPTLLEQRSIVAYMDTNDNCISIEEAYRDKLKLQKQGLMHDLLTGQVRVPAAEEALV